MPEPGHRFERAERGFVKFFGSSRERAQRTLPVLEQLRRSGGHWACGYPAGRRPRAPRDGDVIFMGRLVGGPDDTLICGRALARRYEQGRDDASAEDLALRPWKRQWPHYIRVHHGEYLASTLADGVPLSELMDELGPYAFGPTAENADAGHGNVDPRQSIRQAAAIRLSPAGLSWLNTELDLALHRHGKLSQIELASLDWPDIPLPTPPNR